jgi:hypothetical protein
MSRGRLPLAVKRVDLAVLVLAPGAIPEVPAAIEQPVGRAVELDRLDALAERAEVVVAFLRCADELRFAVVHGPAHRAARPFHPCERGLVLDLFPLGPHVEPVEADRAHQGREAVAEVAADEDRVGGGQMLREFVAEIARDGEVGAFRVELFCAISCHIESKVPRLSKSWSP